MHRENEKFIGLMSGTSMDGIDAVLLETSAGRVHRVSTHAFVPYPAELKSELLALQNPETGELDRSRKLAVTLARENARAVSLLLAESKQSVHDIAALGCHGQTVRHHPAGGYTVQLVDLAALAEYTGITTVGDFRSRDIAAGGQGAPLVPAFHEAVFSSPGETRVILNLGGIANISILRPGQPASGFDTGPANMLADAWMQMQYGLPYDAGGALARTGEVMPDLLAALLAHPYFSLPAPKSTGRELFALPYLLQHLQGNERSEDVLRTLVEFTVRSAADAISFTAPDAAVLFLCGGGASNTLMAELISAHPALHHLQHDTTGSLGIPPQQVEAAAFAWLAGCWLHRKPVSFHHATGAARASVPGCGYWGNTVSRPNPS